MKNIKLYSYFRESLVDFDRIYEIKGPKFLDSKFRTNALLQLYVPLFVQIINDINKTISETS